MLLFLESIFRNMLLFIELIYHLPTWRVVVPCMYIPSLLLLHLHALPVVPNTSSYSPLDAPSHATSSSAATPPADHHGRTSVAHGGPWPSSPVLGFYAHTVLWNGRKMQFCQINRTFCHYMATLKALHLKKASSNLNNQPQEMFNSGCVPFQFSNKVSSNNVFLVCGRCLFVCKFFLFVFS